ncbi:H(+)/Cl(-) exchange transporter ClcA [Microbaculum marinisediminis]|uniref:H(+)/Cl(-) exchange transporter ClcA n=1 Tax=Microbaculum marinisediminis TaxID=2931392 RepID=A0AAW5R189_9HYPH|nr:H(+)/Cl(-) exchange transporter ClcA [Microbaculum sp. A6E488]MCT8972638.1 H(+)/Cl(-) exchange transporter ClcA [Microbaculum sp. A6E488]
MAKKQGETRRTEGRFFLLAALVGIGAGVGGTALHLSVDALMTWPRLLVDQVGKGALAVVLAALITALMVVLSAAIVRRYAPEAAGSGVQEVEGALEGLRPLRWRRVLPVKFVAGVLSLSSGLVLGREGPTIHIGASIAAAVSDWRRLGKLERNGLIAAGAAAGLAAAFNAPLASVLFVIEETRRQFPYTFKTYMGVTIACVLSAFVTEDIAGVGPDLDIAVAAVPLWSLTAFLGLGLVIGALGVLFNFLVLRGLNLAAAIGARAPHAVPIGVGLVIGALVIVLPEATMGHEELILELVAAKNGAILLLAVVAVRLITSVASYSSGVPGGIFAPILTLAACTGLAFGGVLGTVLPDFGPVSVALAVAAMGGLFTASVRAPLVGVVLTLELTGAYEILLPVLVTCLVANVTAEWLGGRPIYEQLLDRTLKRAGIERTRPERETSGLA